MAVWSGALDSPGSSGPGTPGLSALSRLLPHIKCLKAACRCPLIRVRTMAAEAECLAGSPDGPAHPGCLSPEPDVNESPVNADAPVCMFAVEILVACNHSSVREYRREGKSTLADEITAFPASAVRVVISPERLEVR